VNPRLLVVSGPQKGSTYVLSGEEIPVGRDSSNVLTISDAALSRRHCVLTRSDDGYHIRDLDSRNGTFVNGVNVRESPLRHGDQISVGDSVFLLLLREESDQPAETAVEFDESEPQPTAQLRPQDVLYLQPENISRELPASSRLARNLNALLKISRAVHAINDLQQLQSLILELIFEIAPAERGAILQRGTQGEQLDSIFARHRSCGAGQPVQVSRTIIRQVMEQGLAVLGTDVGGVGNLRGVESLAASNIRSLLCVPLTLFQKITGCIYLDTSQSSARFDDEHLQLVAAIAGIAAVALENARRLQWLERENVRLNTEVNLEHNMVGESSRMRSVYQFLSRVAPKDSTVLIEGESGTGKELAARAIHRNSTRAGKAFVAINCAAIPEGLLESELFGHERGAFTDAVALKKGRVESANGGTLFLDEIGELAPALQGKLLRVLQEREFDRIGGTNPITVDIRLIAATNKHLEDAMRAGLFRADLFYRLNVVSLVMPPLRERREDIPALAEYFVVKYSKRCQVRAKAISSEAMACMVNYDWPGNVRELENVIERAMVLSVSDSVQPDDLPEALLEKDPPPAIAAAKYHSTLQEMKKHLIVKAVQDARGNYTEAARVLGIHPNYLHRLIRNLGLKESLRAPSPKMRQLSDSVADARF
jgi:transcriptional regulator with GAF, ATPase, and Fis domain